MHTLQKIEIDYCHVLYYIKHMTIATIQKMKREIKKELIDEFIRPFLEQNRDPEGEYKEEFVKSVLRAAKEKPVYKCDVKTFMKMIS